LHVVGTSLITDANNGINLTLTKTGGFGSALQLQNTSGDSNDLIRVLDSSNNIISQIQPAANGINFAAGRVGIGSSSPSANFDARGTVALSQVLNIDGTSASPITASWAATSAGGKLMTLSNTAAGGSIGNGNTLYLANYSNDNGTFARAFQVTTGGTDRFWVGSNGAGYFASNVGIGTASPGAKLHVAGSTILGDDGTNGRFSVETNTSRIALLASTTGFGAYENLEVYAAETIFHKGGTGEAARIDSSGRLLVGTSTARANFYNSTNSAQFQVEGSGEVSIVRNSNDIFASSIVLGKSRSSTNAIVQSDDVIGILSFQGNDATEFVSAASISVNVDGTPGTNDMPGRIVLSTTADGASSPTERMRIQSDGAINLKTSTIAGNDGVRFNVGSIVIAGSAWNSGAGTNAVKWSSVSGALTWDSSSRLVKEDIENCPYGLSELKMLKPRIYTRTDSGEKEIGFIADEVQSIIPEIVPTGPKSCITGNEDDAELIPISVNYDKFAAVLTKALQDAIGEIESLKARITALETP
jgi:hypothetical protein